MAPGPRPAPSTRPLAARRERPVRDATASPALPAGLAFSKARPPSFRPSCISCTPWPAPHLGGMEFRVLEQAQWLKEQGHVVAIAAPPGSETLKAAHERSLEAVGIDFESAYSPSTVLGCAGWSSACASGHRRPQPRGRQDQRAVPGPVRRRAHPPFRQVPAHQPAQAPGMARRLPSRHRHQRRRPQRHRVSRLRAGRARQRGRRMGRPAFLPGRGQAALRQRMRAELGLDADAFVVATIGMLRPESARTTCCAWSSSCASARFPPSRWWSARPPPRRPPSAPAARAGR